MSTLFQLNQVAEAAKEFRKTGSYVALTKLISSVDALEARENRLNAPLEELPKMYVCKEHSWRAHNARPENYGLNESWSAIDIFDGPFNVILDESECTFCK